MLLMVLNTQFEVVEVIDIFNSLIWTDRYSGYGDFELCDLMVDAPKFIKEDYYLVMAETEHIMIVEDQQIASDVENGDTLQITGRSLESLLDRRIVWSQTILSGNLQNGVKKLLDENVISPTDTNRRINNFIFEASTDPAITSLLTEAQFTGDTVYDAIKNICDANKIGFKITLSSSNQFVFKLYAGVDRSYSQTANPYITFSPKFENIMNSNYLTSKKMLKTVTLVAGEGEGSARRTVSMDNRPMQEEKIKWTNLSGCTYSEVDNSLRKNSSGYNGWDSGGYSLTQSINNTQNGHVSMIVAATNTHIMMGFNSDANADHGYAGLDYAVYLNTNSTVYIYESSVDKGHSVQYSIGDIIKIMVDYGVVKYYKNGILFYTSVVTPTFPLYPDCSIYTPNSIILNSKFAVSDLPQTDIHRREMFTDARDVSSTADGRTLTTDEYNAQLRQRGIEKLAGNVVIKSFEGKVDTTMYNYGEDFFIGDIVQIVNEYLIESKSRVTEVVHSQSISGIDILPTCTTIE